MIVTYRLGNWIIVARNGSRVTSPFNVTSYSLIPVKVNNHTLKWGQSLTLRASPGKPARVKIEYGDKAVTLVFNVITAREAREEVERNWVQLTLQELSNLKLEYVVKGSVVGLLGVLAAFLIRRKALLARLSTALSFIFFVSILAFLANSYLVQFGEPQYYWLIFTIVASASFGLIPMPRGVYVLEPELSKRNVNLTYYVTYKDRRGLPRVAEQSLVAGFKRLLGLERDPILVNGVTRETMSLNPSWTLDYEDPLVIVSSSEFRRVKIDETAEAEK